MTPDEFLQAVFEQISEYVNSQFDDVPISSTIPPSSLQKISDLKLPLEGMGLQNALSDLATFFEHSIRTHSPGFMNPLWGGMSLTGVAGDMVATITNNSMYTRELSPFASLIEIEILRRACELIGYAHGFGSFTSGGSSGNLMGLLCARQHLRQDSGLNGFDGSKHVIFVSEEAHFSVMMAANVTGIGRQNVMKIRCLEDGSMDVNHLEEEILFTKREGFVPLCVIATAGTTVLGSFDPIRDIVRVAKSHNIWCHVDAAWGGMALFSSSTRKLLDGIEQSDSVCWDAHKMMGLPLMSSMFLVNDVPLLRKVCSHTTDADYLYYEEDNEFDLGHYSLQCARRNDVLKLWLAWREIGDAGWAKMVERYLDIANYLEQKVIENEHLEMMAPRLWSNVCFRYHPSGTDVDLDSINAEIRERLKNEGQFMVSRATVRGFIVLRAVVANNAVSKESIDAFVGNVIRIGDDVLKGLPPKY
jgi:glutamate/tyrosine decarboxylase-like PLP-dependent enzyme